jgi:hypothetical protein
MSVVLVPSINYLSDQRKIMDYIIDHALKTEDDAIPMLKFFRKEEKDLQKRIKNSPLSAGIDFPRPVKKAVSSSGKYIILYTYIPIESETNAEVTRVNLDTIIPAASDKYNDIVLKQLPSFEFD